MLTDGEFAPGKVKGVGVSGGCNREEFEVVEEVGSGAFWGRILEKERSIEAVCMARQFWR